MLFFAINEFFFKKRKNNFFKNIILFIIIFDVFILGIYFGSFRVFERFNFLENEFFANNDKDISLTRLEIIKFSFNQINDYLFFGYGPGSFEILFQTKYSYLKNTYASHAHSDLIQYIGEFGIFGFLLFFFSILKFLKMFKDYNLKSCLLFFYLFIILFFDFSLHIPLIQILFIIFFTLNQKLTKFS